MKDALKGIDVVGMLLLVAQAAFNLADNTCEEGDIFTVTDYDFKALSEALGKLDVIPEPKGNLIGDGPFNAGSFLAETIKMAKSAALEKGQDGECERWAERLKWINDKYQIDCSGLDSGDLLDGVEYTIECALRDEKKAGMLHAAEIADNVPYGICECELDYACASCVVETAIDAIRKEAEGGG